ncbi:putative aminotransferase family protein [Durotheca rogersii]|uniref:putative aminotransferase family protein n=1 Tax=Durotheca rogersii TaxID=419775 RepID=UPI00221F4C09|nr:putative aminotransferase family protein [Durotheca rogersii]KAI5862035.1 putative aminotransferase family protein [Durotheca rogersii]
MTIVYHDNPDSSKQTTTAKMSGTPEVPFGAEMRRKHFAFAPRYTPLNHGSYGTVPKSVRATHVALEAEVDAAPDPFISLDFYGRLAEQRALAARVLGAADPDEVVFVPNATTGTDTVLKNFEWQDGDTVLVYELVYGAVAHGLSWLEETRGVHVHVARPQWPLPDDELVATMVAAAREVQTTPGRRLRLAIVDSIISMPGLRVPYERLVPALQAEGAMVLVDAAHGIGHIDINLDVLRPDFLVTNLHKWFFVPRGCAALYIPRRHQPLIRTSLPTSHGFTPRRRLGVIDEDGETFTEMFSFTGSDDTTAWLCVQAAIDFRTNVCGGEAAIKAYCREVAQRSAAVVADIFGTEILDCPGSCIRDCFFANVRLPIELGTDDADSGSGSGKVSPEHAPRVVRWIKIRGERESGFYFQTWLYRGAWWWRLSGAIYVEVEDFRRGAEVLKALCERIRNGELARDPETGPLTA